LEFRGFYFQRWSCGKKRKEQMKMWRLSGAHYGEESVLEHLGLAVVSAVRHGVSDGKEDESFNKITKTNEGTSARNMFQPQLPNSQLLRSCISSFLCICTLCTIIKGIIKRSRPST